MAGKSGPRSCCNPGPVAIEERIDAARRRRLFEWLKALILGVRNIRGEMNVGPGKELELLLRKAGRRIRTPAPDRERYFPDKSWQTLLQLIRVLAEGEEASLVPHTTALVRRVSEVLVPSGLQRMAGLDRQDPAGRAGASGQGNRCVF